MSRLSGGMLTTAVRTLIPEVVARIRPVTATGNRFLWRELSCCVLSSQVPYDVARAAARQLDRLGILYSSTTDAQRSTPQRLFRQIRSVLSERLKTGSGLRRYRFANTRADQLASAWWTIQERFGTLRKLLQDLRDPVQIRTFLVASVSGVGPKQASMFLRNIGFSYDLAVIDTHVSAFMLETGLCEDLPMGNLRSLSKYEHYEVILRREAETLGFPVGVVDWAIWFVMKAAADLEREWRS